MCCDGKSCRYLYVGTSGGTLLVIDQEPGEGKMLRLVQMTPRVTANRGLFPQPPRPLFASPRPVSPPLLALPAAQAVRLPRRQCACRHSANDREPRH